MQSVSTDLLCIIWNVYTWMNTNARRSKTNRASKFSRTRYIHKIHFRGFSGSTQMLPEFSRSFPPILVMVQVLWPYTNNVPLELFVPFQNLHCSWCFLKELSYKCTLCSLLLCLNTLYHRKRFFCWIVCCVCIISKKINACKNKT